MKSLRVMITGERYPDSFADNLAVALEDMGHAVSVVAPFRGPVAGPGRLRTRLRAEVPSAPRLALRLQSHVVDIADRDRPDLLLNVDFRLSWPVVRELSRRGVATAFWFPDSPGNLGRESHVVAGYDAIFVKDSRVAEHYRKTLGLNAHFLAEACNPRWHRPPEGVTPGDDGGGVLIAGNMYATRYVLARRLIDAGIQLRLHGPPWPRWLPPDERLAAAGPRAYLARESKAHAFRGAAIVLNALASHEGDGTNCRLFEAAGCGAIVLTEWRDRLPELFDVPREILVFRSFEELVEQVRAAAALPAAARRTLGDAAARRAHADHGYACRFVKITEAVGRG